MMTTTASGPEPIQPVSEPLRAEERQLGEARLAAYTRTAWMFTGLPALSLLGFLVKAVGRASRAGRSDDPLVLGVLALVVVASGALVWYFGWRQVLAMREDLKAGQKQRVRGPVTWLDRQQNAYGQTVTHLKVAGIRATSREEALASVQKGEEVVLELLPRSRVILSCTARRPGPRP